MDSDIYAAVSFSFAVKKGAKFELRDMNNYWYIHTVLNNTVHITEIFLCVHICLVGINPY